MNDDFDKRDPLWKVLGTASPVKVRGGFADEVRAAVSVETEQVEGARVGSIRRSGRTRVAWKYGLGALAAAACLVFALMVLNRPGTPSGVAPVAGNNSVDLLETRYLDAVAQAPDADEALESFYYINSLLAERDVSSLDDEAIVALLY